MIEILIAAGIIALVSVLVLQSNKLMNIVTNLYGIIITALGAYGLFFISEPVSILNDNLRVDALSHYEILIAGFIFWLAAFYAKGYVENLIAAGELNQKNVKFFYLAFNSLLLSLVLAFSSNNLALLWIFAELSTMLSAVLIVLLNAKENIVAAMKYVFITSIAMVFSFLGLILLYTITKYNLGIATLNWDTLLENAGILPPELFIMSFVLFFIGFGAKAGLVPFHIWLPAAHSKAPSNVSAILSGTVINVGTYALIRIFAIAKQNPDSFYFASILFLVFGVLTIGVAAFSMITRTNLKKLIAFSSVEGVGLIVLGLGIGSSTAMFWVLFLIGANALVKALLFFSAGIVHRQYLSIKIDAIHNLFDLQPLSAIGLIIGSLALTGMPFLPVFIAKLLLLSELAKSSILLMFIVLLLMLIVASSFVMFLLQIINKKEKLPTKYHAPISMKLPIIMLLIMIFLLGINMPESLQNVLHSAIVQLGW